PGAAPGRRCSLCSVAQVGGGLLRPTAAQETSAGTDDEPAYLGLLAWHRVTVRARRCRPAETADVARGAARSGRARLSARPRHHRSRTNRSAKLGGLSGTP